MKFNEIIKSLRNEKGLTQSDLSNKLNIARSTLASYENGSRFPDKVILEEIADFFNVDIDFLYGKSNVRKKAHFDEKGKAHYYLNDNVANTVDVLLKNNDYMVLLEASQDLSDDDLRFVINLVQRMKNNK